MDNFWNEVNNICGQAACAVNDHERRQLRAKLYDFMDGYGARRYNIPAADVDVNSKPDPGIYTAQNGVATGSPQPADAGADPYYIDTFGRKIFIPQQKGQAASQAPVDASSFYWGPDPDEAKKHLGFDDAYVVEQFKNNIQQEAKKTFIMQLKDRYANAYPDEN